MALTPGTRLGPYAIAAQMGEVYRARDTNWTERPDADFLPAQLIRRSE